ncbi:MAG TPA: polysaccharide biosynthesis/export family protein [Opitutaceae bacterium]|nr:polysaccharide biosynthesis/export family protein [Opitutaceae bacterium]
MTKPSLSYSLFIRSKYSKAASILGLVSVLALVSGCETTSTGKAPTAASSTSSNQSKSQESLTLREGDVIKISVPGAASLDSVQTIRRDGRIALPLIGEVQATGKTPLELQNELVALYAPQVVSKEVTVTVVSSTFPAFVTGAVLRPGKIASDHALTVLEAIMEAGGYDAAKADLKAVKVVRQLPNGRTESFNVNVKSLLDGTQTEPFYLRPSDMVIVPERFVLF